MYIWKDCLSFVSIHVLMIVDQVRHTAVQVVQ